MTFGRVLACIAAVLFAAALSIDASWARANHWLDGHALTTDLISSAFFALLVSYAVSRISRQREAARMRLPAREVLHRIVFAGQEASTYLRKLIEERADEIEVAEAEAPAGVAEDDPMMAALAEAARAELPNLPDHIAAVVRDGIAAEGLDKRLQLENADFRRAAAHRGVKSIAVMLAARENLPPSLKTIYAL